MSEQSVSVVLRLPISTRDWLRDVAEREDRSVNYIAKRVFAEAQKADQAREVA